MTEKVEQNIKIEDGWVFEVRSVSKDLLVFRAHPAEEEGMFQLEPLVGARHTILVSEDILRSGGMISRRLRIVGINPPEEVS